jgi:N-acetylmuramoyl-L-alanine amidase
MVFPLKMERNVKRVILAIASAILALSPAYGEGNSGALSEVRSEYVRLRNIDPTTDDPGVRRLWRELESKMAHPAQVGATTNSQAALRHMIDRAGVLTRLYRVEGDESRLRTAKMEVSSALGALGLESDIPSEIQSSLRHEAVILKSDIYLMEKSQEEAETLLHSTRSTTKDARVLSRLNGIRNGTFKRFFPAPELERPNIVSLSWSHKGSKRSSSKKIVVIDPGHGGDDAGAVGRQGLLEKEVTLDISKRVVQLAAEMGFRVVLTRDDDTFVPLARRTRIANHLGAAAFVSIHHNASPKHTLDGLESFYLDNTDDQAGKKLADRENSAGASGAADDIDFMLSDLIQTGKMEDSIRLTHIINNSLSQSFGHGSEGVTVRGVKKAPFFVLVGAHMPCTLLEILFIDHPMDAERLAQPRFRERAARAIVRGIAAFLGDGVRERALPQEVVRDKKSERKKVAPPIKKGGLGRGTKQGKKTRTSGK